MSGADLAAAAEALVGAPFRLHGRDPASGLDCIGVLAASLAACGRPAHLPTGYALRTRALPGLEAIVSDCAMVPVAGPAQAGDVLLVRVGACQFHLLIALDERRFVHAHAGLRRVVCSHMPAGWAVVGHWRLRAAD